MSSIHFIGGEKGGVGKSVVARLFAQYLIDRERPWRAFDTDRSHGALLRFYEGFSQPLAVDAETGLDAIVETAVEAERTVLVDLAAQTEAAVHRWIEGADVLNLADELGFGVTFWHVMDGGKDSVALLGRLLDRYGDRGRYVVVLNEGRASDFTTYETSDVRARVEALAVPTVRLRALHATTMDRIDRTDQSFWAAANNTGPDTFGLMARQRVRVWMRHAYDAFDHLGG